MQARIEGVELITRRSWRRSIFEAWDHRCAYCNAPAQSLDHIWPKAKGGLTVRSNLAPACLGCNSSKSAENWINWFRQQVFWSIERERQIADWLENPEGISLQQEVA